MARFGWRARNLAAETAAFGGIEMKSSVRLFSAALICLAVAAAPAMAQCGTPAMVTLFGGQTIDTGTVTVSNDSSSLTVTYMTNDPW
jgi:hypothetical protein